MLKKICCLLFIAACTGTASAQTDTFRIATYNLLHYGRPGANRHTLKNMYLQPILGELKPGIICFNEIDTTLPAVLDTLNTLMPFAMQHGPVHNTTRTDILDGLFWRSGKFRYLRDTVICSYIRDIAAYDLYYDDPQLGRTHDTVRLKVITAHLKSSNAVADRVARDTETQRVARYLDRLPDTLNIIMLGDFNLYRSSEAAYLNLTATANIRVRLNDPLNRPGNWDGNATFAAVHTQSPRLTQLSDEGAGGGLDSRFDFILMSDALIRGWKGLRYIPGTYQTMGNDSQHYNKALTDTPAHPDLPASMIGALYRNSDHLPVYADIAVSPPQWTGPVAIPEQNPVRQLLAVTNPFGPVIHYRLKPGTERLTYRLVSRQGQLIQAGVLLPDRHALELHYEAAPGLYFLQVLDGNGHRAVYKLLHE